MSPIENDRPSLESLAGKSENIFIRRAEPRDLSIAPVAHEPSLLIAEARSECKTEDLFEFLTRHQGAVRRSLEAFGAILFRGFGIANSHAFEHLLRGVLGFKPIHQYFPIENGRQPVVGLPSVYRSEDGYYSRAWHHHIQSFHSENNFSVDVPRAIAFWCVQPPIFGAETGFIKNSLLYQQIDPSVRRGLEGDRILRSWMPIDTFKTLTGLEDSELADIYQDFEIEEKHVGKKRFVIFKTPLVMSINGQGALQANYESDLPAFSHAFHRNLSRRYRSPLWWVHLVMWQRNQCKNRSSGVSDFTQRMPNDPPLMKFMFNRKDIENMARAAFEGLTAAKWQRGDILLLDNAQMIHGPLPGRTGIPGIAKRREIQVMLLNAINLKKYRQNGSVVLDQFDWEEDHRTLGERLYVSRNSPQIIP